MFEPWRLQLREAEEALKDGRLEEAQRLLAQETLQAYLPTKRLQTKLAQRLAQRGRARAGRGESSAGWQDLQLAEELAGEGNDVIALRQELIHRTTTEVQRYLEAGEPAAAIQRLEQLEQRAPATTETRQLRQLAVELFEAQRQARRGEFGSAMEHLDRAANTPAAPRLVDALRKEYQRRAAESRELRIRLHALVAAEAWTEVLSVADQILELAPENRLAVSARTKAWSAVGMKMNRTLVPSSPESSYPEDASPVTEQAAGSNRFFLWVDAVGGFLVCPGERIVLGQPAADGSVDVPLLGDLSRRHAVIHRMGEGYLLEPLREVRLAGREITSPTTLVDGQLLELGGGVKLRFRRPHPLSNSARLEFASHHRTQPSADGVLLLAESCVLGPGSNCHVACLDWPHDVVLFRQGEQLWCRSQSTLSIDGGPPTERGPLERRSRVEGEGFSFSLEPA